MSSVSLLIGAGFSIPLGYPSANALTSSLLGLAPDVFSIQSDGTIYMLPTGQADNPGNMGNFIHKHFFVEVMDYYIKRFGGFQYEDFFDHLFQNRNDNGRDVGLEAFIKAFYAKHNVGHLHHPVDFITTALKLLDQCVTHFIVDGFGKQFYERVYLGIGTVPEHHNILTCIKKLGENNTVHIHSLNHDMVFERYNSSDYLQGELADGFEELGSPYYTRPDMGHYKGRMIRISNFTNKYGKTFNLYKLHSSVDYYTFYGEKDGVMFPETMVKTGMWIRTTELYKEVNNGGQLEYFNSWAAYKPDFLTGTNSKILRYKDKVYFEPQFKNFENNLKQSDMLLVVGYGCNDKEVNNVVYNNFPIGKKPVYVASSPTPSQPIIDFMRQTQATHIPKYVQAIVPTDIGL